jgi:hypothetical protein
MRRFRLHLGTLVILVLVLGVGLAALRESTHIWDSSLFTVTLGILLLSVLIAVHRTAKKRAFWVGFALFGAAYLGLSSIPAIESRLMTTKALAYLASMLPWLIPAGTGVTYLDHDSDGDMDLYVANSQSVALYPNNSISVFSDVTVSSGVNAAGNQAPGSGTIFINSPGRMLLGGSVGTTENFVRIGHSICALIAAFLGGQLARWLCGAKEPPLSAGQGGSTILVARPGQHPQHRSS